MRCRIRTRSRLCSLLLLQLLLSACMSWQTQQASPAGLISDERPSVVRITRKDSTRTILREPALRGDTLYGYPQAAAGVDTLRLTSVSLEDVQEIATLRSDPTKNTLLITGIAVGAFSTLCFLADAFGCGPESSTDILPLMD
jgi:hypothetical protein